MIEQQPRTNIVYESPPPTGLLELVPKRLAIAAGVKVFGGGLTPEGTQALAIGLGKILRREPINPGDDIYPVYQDAIAFQIEGEENIPRSGATLFIGNHDTHPLLASMVQFIEGARIVNNARVDVQDSVMRESRIIMQRGIRTKVKLLGLSLGTHTVPFSEAFYFMGANSLNFVIVDRPKHDEAEQVVNKQHMPKGLAEEIVAGQALFIYPQGKKGSGLNMPDKSGFIAKMRKFDVNVVGVLFERGEPGDPFRIAFGKPTHIQDLLVNEAGEPNLNHFAQQHLAPLQSANRRFRITT